MSKARRLIWVGLDGSSAGFYRKFIDEGKMPTFARLEREGVFSESLPIPPCDTPTNWTALQTGVHTGTTEVVSFFTHRPGEPLNVAHNNLHSGAIKAELIWEAAERQGKHCIMLNWPCSWPPRVKQSVQVNGTGPYSSSWRLTFARVYRQGNIGGRKLDPAATKKQGGLAEEITLRPAEGWANAPASQRTPLEFSFPLLGTERFSWSELGMRVEKVGEGADPGSPVYHVLVTDSEGKGYNRAIVARSRDGAAVVADLRVGQWSDWVSEQFGRERVLEQLRPIEEEQVEGVFQFKLLALSTDGSSFGLFRTDIWQADGWAEPREVALELREVVGPFTEGLELPSAPARMLDEWGTYYEQLDRAIDWYVGAAEHLTGKYDWDILAVQLHIQDGINHVLARDITPEDPDYNEQTAAKAWKVYEAAYAASDRLLARLIEDCADEDTVICVVSDHGALPTLRECLYSSALARAGLMSYSKDEASGRWKVDWSKTRVFPRRGHVWVNLKGRDPDGIVEPEEYDKVREQAIRALLGIYDEEWQTRPVVMAVRKEDAANFGQWGEAVGDIITFVAPCYADSDKDYAALPSDPLTAPATGPTDIGCAHHPYLPSASFGIWSVPAVFFLAGPGVRRGYERPHPITQVDVCPTLCYLLGIAPPRDCEGKIVIDVLEESRVATTDPVPAARA